MRWRIWWCGLTWLRTRRWGWSGRNSGEIWTLVRLIRSRHPRGTCTCVLDCGWIDSSECVTLSPNLYIAFVTTLYPRPIATETCIQRWNTKILIPYRNDWDAKHCRVDNDDAPRFQAWFRVPNQHSVRIHQIRYVDGCKEEHVWENPLPEYWIGNPPAYFEMTSSVQESVSLRFIQKISKSLWFSVLKFAFPCESTKVISLGFFFFWDRKGCFWGTTCSVHEHNMQCTWVTTRSVHEFVNIQNLGS